jgi:hypothetical protein
MSDLEPSLDEDDRPRRRRRRYMSVAEEERLRGDSTRWLVAVGVVSSLLLAFLFIAVVEGWLPLPLAVVLAIVILLLLGRVLS